MSEPGKPVDPVVAAMVAQQSADAAVTYAEGRWRLTMTWELPHAPERVWPKLTEPEELAKWSPVVPDRPLGAVGPASARETPEGTTVDAEVLVSERPRELVHRWGEHLLRWTLTPAGNGCRLTLEQTFDDRAQRASFAAGWRICVAVLAVTLAGKEVERVVGDRALDYGWQDLAAHYGARLA